MTTALYKPRKTPDSCLGVQRLPEGLKRACSPKMPLAPAGGVSLGRARACAGEKMPGRAPLN
jgi:hypothetical protein